MSSDDAHPDRSLERARARAEATLFGVPRPAERVGRYLVLDRIGAGGMGVVYSAFDPQLERRVALKLLRQNQHPSAQRRALHEATALAKLNHPNVVAVYDAGIAELESGSEVFIAMELVEGITLRDWLSDAHRSLRDILGVFVQAGQGLAAAHDRGLVHRDFKPDNVIIDRTGHVRVMDFGLARRFSQDEDLPTPGIEAGATDPGREAAFTNPGAVVGTPAYMAPEQFRRSQVDARADQFSFCVALYEAACGRRPFGGDGPPEIAADIASRPVEFPKGRVPGWLGRIVVRGLDRDPERRFPSMHALLTELARDPSKRRRRWLAAIVVSSLVASAFGGRALWREHERRACEAAGEEIASVWNDDTREAMRTGMLATKAAYATTSFEHAAEWIDAKARAWSNAREASCNDHSIDPATALRIDDCLAHRKAEIGEVVDLLVEADAQVAQRAVAAAARVRDASQCTDRTWLDRQPAMPAYMRERILRLRKHFGRIAGLLSVAAYQSAFDDAGTALAEAELVGHAATIAEARYLVGYAADRLGKPERAHDELVEAYYTAAVTHADDVAAQAAELLVAVDSELKADDEAALAWSRTAQMWHDRNELGATDLHRMTLLVNLNNVADRFGHYDDARAHAERALAIAEHELGAEHPITAAILDNLGIARARGGDQHGAIELHERALEVRTRTLGGDHPDVAQSFNNIGVAHFKSGEFEDAAAAHGRALAIRQRAFGEEHPDVAGSLGNLADVATAQGGVSEGIEMHERALAIRERVLGRNHPDVGINLSNLAIAHRRRGQHAEAEVLARRAVAVFEGAYGPDHPYVGQALQIIGDAVFSLERREEALPLHLRALAIKEAALGKDHPSLAYPLVGVGSALIYVDRSGEAVPYLERAVALREATPGERAELGLARVRLAEAIWKSGGDKVRAIDLARTAIGDFEGDSAAAASARAETQRFIDEHPL